MKKIIIIGATSGIGLEVARLYINRGWSVGVAGRRTEQLEQVKQLSPDTVFTEQIDVTSPDASDKLQSLIGRMGGIDIFLLSSGVGAQNASLDAEVEINTARTNCEGFMRMITTAYNHFKVRKDGHIAVISSIAGTKALGIAPSYSATKRFQNFYIDALSQLSRINKENISFTDIRPGFVATELLKSRNYPMLMKADKVAGDIVRALDKRKRVAVIDWRYRMLVSIWRLIPQWIWERMPVR